MNIAVFMPNYIGDILMATPALRLLRRQFPDAVIAAVVRPACAELLDDNPVVSRIIYRRRHPETLRALRSFAPDAALLLRTTFFNALAARLAGSRCSVGLREDLGNLFLTHAIPRDQRRTFREECLALSAAFVARMTGMPCTAGEDARILDLHGWTVQMVAAKVDALLQRLGISGGRRFIVLHPAATRPAKVLDDDRYRALVRALVRRTDSDVPLLLTGAAGDRAFAQRITDGTPAQVLCGELDLMELAALLNRAWRFVSPDTGPAFIAQAVMLRDDQRVVTFFLSTDPARYGPYHSRVRAVYRPVPCAPCYREECPRRPPYNCRAALPVEAIVDEVFA